jgi:hypothetical protein
VTTSRIYTAAAQSTDSFRVAPDLVQMPAGKDKLWIHSARAGTTKLMPEVMFHMVQNCVKFDTLDRHAESICRALWYTSPFQMKEVRQTLGELADHGLFVSHDHLIGQFREEPDEAPPPISAVAIPTRNRLDNLKVGVESYAQCSREYERQIEFFIADQSDDAESRRATLSFLAQTKEKYGCQIYYGGPEEKEALAHRLAEYTGHPFALVNFAVSNIEGCPTAYGANRNALLLSTVGSLTLQTDDDSVCRLAPSPQTTEGLQLTSHYSPLTMLFLSAQETETLNNRFNFGDVLAKHEELLGKSVAQCLDEHAGLNLDQVSASFFTRSQPRRVLVTSLGNGGDSAIGTPFWFLNRGPEEHANLVRSEESYRYTMMHHQVYRFATSAAISDGTYCGAMNLGLDNRWCLPPFMPVQRNEDGIFAQLLKLSSCGYFGFLPWMILHNRPSRNYTREDLRQYASSVMLGDFVSMFLTNFCTRAAIHNDSARNLFAVGNVLAQWGAAPQADFEEMLKLLLADRACQLIANLQNSLRTESRKPEFWAEDVDMCISALEENMARDGYIVATDLRSSFSQNEVVPLVQRLVLQFGQLLQIWPDLRQAALELKVQGWQPFRQV